MQILNRYIRLVTPSADYAFGYDDVGRTTSITADLDGFTQSIVMTQTFDAASNRTQLAASIGSTADFVDDFTFDNLLRMTRIERQGAMGGNTVAEIRVDLAYNALGQFATIDRYTDLAGTKLAVSTAYGYDGANRLASLYHTQSTNDLAKYDFSWDNADRLTSIDSLQDGVTNFTYDAGEKRGQGASAISRRRVANERVVQGKT